MKLSFIFVILIASFCTVTSLSLHHIAIIHIGVVSLGDYVGQTVRDEVGEGNYTYYTLKQAGELELVLTSEKGDADLYLSSDKEHPTYLLDEHSLSSATCGEDRIHVPESMRRPLHIGVYGHPRHHISCYSLDVVIIEKEWEEDFFRDRTLEEEEGPAAYSQPRAGGGNRPRGEGGGGGRAGGSQDEDYGSTYKMIWTILRSILEILINVII